MVGRICPAKDPAFFLDVAAHLGQWDHEAELRWVGGGSDEDVDRLTSAGAVVSGWVEGTALSEELDSLSIYVHTSAYEGFPLSVLDAAARKVPIVARRIPALEGTPLLMVDSPEEMARTVLRLRSDPEALAGVVARGDELLEDKCDEKLSASLRELYSLAWGSMEADTVLAGNLQGLAEPPGAGR